MRRINTALIASLSCPFDISPMCASLYTLLLHKDNKAVISTVDIIWILCKSLFGLNCEFRDIWPNNISRWENDHLGYDYFSIKGKKGCTDTYTSITIEYMYSNNWHSHLAAHQSARVVCSHTLVRWLTGLMSRSFRYVNNVWGLELF